MIIEARNTRESYSITEQCDVEVLLTMDQPLNAGDRIEFQFPNSWSMLHGPSFTREFQADDSEGEHYISVCARDAEDAEFEIDIQKRHLNFPEGLARHGRLITATLKGGNVPAGASIRIGYENTFAPYVAEEDSLWLRVNGIAPDAAPALKVTSAAHESFRVIAPSSAKPGETRLILIIYY